MPSRRSYISVCWAGKEQAIERLFYTQWSVFAGMATFECYYTLGTIYSFSKPFLVHRRTLVCTASIVLLSLEVTPCCDADRKLCAVAMQRCYCLYRRGWLAFAPTIGLQIWSFWPFVKTVAPSLSLQCNVTMKFKMADQTRSKWRQFGRFCAWNVHKMTNYTSLRPSYIPRIQQRQIKLGPHVLRGYSKLFTAVRHRTMFRSNLRSNFPSSPLVSSILCFLWRTAVKKFWFKPSSLGKNINLWNWIANKKSQISTQAMVDN